MQYLIKKKINSRFFSFFSEFIHFLQITLKNKKMGLPASNPNFTLYILKTPYSTETTFTGFKPAAIFETSIPSVS